MTTSMGLVFCYNPDMKLLLTSAGLRNKTIVQSLQDLVEKPFAELSVAFIPTAANIENGDKSWLMEDLVAVHQLGWKSFDIVDISALSEEVIRRRLEVVDVVVVGGGNTYHIMSWINKTYIQELLSSKIYVGISAGSMITTKEVQFGWDRDIYDEEIAVDKGKGLGLVNFHIFPHLNSHDFPKANMSEIEHITQNTGDTIYAIDNDTAIVVVDGEIRIVSEGQWEKIN